MDTPLLAVVHKEIVHIGGGKTIVTTKPDKLKSAMTADNERKALANLRSTYLPVVGASKNVDLKHKSTAKGKKNKMTQGNFGTTKKRSVTGPLKGANLNRKSVLQGNFGKGNKPFNDISTDDEIRQCYGKKRIGGLSWTAKDEANLAKKRIMSRMMAVARGLPVSELEQPFTSEEEGYETDESNFKISVPGRLSSVYTLEELDDPLGLAKIELEDYPLPELKLNDDYKEFSFDSDGRNDAVRPQAAKNFRLGQSFTAKRSRSERKAGRGIDLAAPTFASNICEIAPTSRAFFFPRLFFPFHCLFFVVQDGAEEAPSACCSQPLALFFVVQDREQEARPVLLPPPRSSKAL